ncbi:hypothetical protein BJX64DRAFT_290109 [Aspergillus heterothallicus]
MEFPYIVPPSFYSILGDEPTTSEPSEEQTREALRNSREYWYKAAAIARNNQTVGLPPEATMPHFMLQKVPRICMNPRKTLLLHIGASLVPSLAVEGRANWVIEGPKDCGIADAKEGEARALQIGISKPTGFNFSNRSFHYWKGAKGQEIPYHNYLAVLTLGWCYIISARFVELYGKDARMEYTGSRAPHWEAVCDRTNNAVDVRIDICTSDASIAWWFSVILAGAQGWRGIIPSRVSGEGRGGERREFFTPWTVRGTAPMSFAIRGVSHLTGSYADEPLPSAKAFRALANFAQQYDLGDQFQIALTSALMFSTHNLRATTARLPPPTPRNTRIPVGLQDQTSISAEYSQLYYDVQYYITLSCDPDAIMSTLCGMFWEPGVPRSLAGVWLHPILKEVPDDEEIRSKPGLFDELLAIICRIRRPTISALWLGAVTSGLGPAIIDEVSKFSQLPDEVASSWTGALQGFLDIPGSGPYLDELIQTTVSEADVARLHRIVPLAGNDRPDSLISLSPWAPFGQVNKSSCLQRIMRHFGCDRHHLRYETWVWLGQTGSPEGGPLRPATPAATQSEVDLARTIQPLDPPKWGIENDGEDFETGSYVKLIEPEGGFPTDAMDEPQFFPTLGEREEDEEENLGWVRSYYAGNDGNADSDGDGNGNGHGQGHGAPEEVDITDQYVVED